MKNIKITTTLIAIWLLQIATLLPAQTYTVVRAHGKVSLQSNRKALKREDKFKADPLQFASAKDFLIVLDEKEATFLIYPDVSLNKHKIKPLRIPSGTRRGLILNDLQLRQFLNENDSLLLLNGRFSLVLGKEAFPMDEKHFFYVEYTWRGQTIPKRLSHWGDTLVIDARELYKVDNKPVDPKEVSEKCTLWYRNEQTQESVEYPGYSRPIYIVRADDAAIKAEIQMLLRPYQKEPFHVRMKVASTYLSRFYGVAGDWELERLIKEVE